ADRELRMIERSEIGPQRPMCRQKLKYSHVSLVVPHYKAWQDVAHAQRRRLLEEPRLGGRRQEAAGRKSFWMFQEVAAAGQFDAEVPIPARLAFNRDGVRYDFVLCDQSVLEQERYDGIEIERGLRPEPLHRISTGHIWLGSHHIGIVPQ